MEVKNRKAAGREILLISEDRKLVSLGRISGIFYNTSEYYLRVIGTKNVCCLTTFLLNSGVTGLQVTAKCAHEYCMTLRNTLTKNSYGSYMDRF
jgi:hypothetical protein